MSIVIIFSAILSTTNFDRDAAFFCHYFYGDCLVFIQIAPTPQTVLLIGLSIDVYFRIVMCVLPAQ
jgi:hypothetical protein